MQYDVAKTTLATARASHRRRAVMAPPRRRPAFRLNSALAAPKSTGQIAAA
jgi:hypothetical protein